MRHWTLTRDADGLARLVFDKADATANTLSAEVLAELNDALSELDRDPPKGLVIASGKANGFIAGADVDEFRVVHDAAGAIAIVKRGWDTFERLAAVPYPTVALIRGFCLGGGLELALACRYRIVVDDPGTRLGLPEVMLGIVPGWGGIRRLPRLIGAPAAFDLLLSGRTIDARRAKRLGIADECVPARIMENAARGVLLAKRAPRSLRFPLSLTLNPLVRPIIAAQARKAVARRARREHYPAPYAILELWVKYDGNALAAPASDPASIPALLEGPTAANLIRVFGLQERLKSLGKDDDFKAAHVHVVGAGTMGGDIAAWCALRGLTVTLQDQNAERIAPAMARASRLFEGRQKDPRRARDAADRLIPDVAGAGIARADVIIEAIFENLDAKRALFAAVEAKAKPSAVLATNTSSIPLEDIAAGMQDGSRLVGLHFFNPVAKMMLVEIVVGKATRPDLSAQGGGVRPPDRQAAAAGQERSRLSRQPRAGTVPRRRDALHRRGAGTGDDRRGGARVRDADGADRARRHRRSRHLRRRRQDACTRHAALAQGGSADRGRPPRAQDGARLLRLRVRQAREKGTRRDSRRSRRAADRAAGRRSEGGAGGRHRRRRRPGRCRRHLRHRLRPVHRRPPPSRRRRSTLRRRIPVYPG